MTAPPTTTQTFCFFNGGKMHHIFTFSDETRKYLTDGTCTSPAAEQALLHGILYYKIDGSNGMIQVIRQSTTTTTTSTSTTTGDEVSHEEPKMIIFKLYQRLDTRGKTPSQGHGHGQITPLPDGKNAKAYPGHSYYYSEITTDPNTVTGKRLLKRNRAMRDLIERHRDTLMAMKQEWISVEWVGQMFNKTPKVPHSIAMAIHQHQQIPNLTIEEEEEGIGEKKMDIINNNTPITDTPVQVLQNKANETSSATIDIDSTATTIDTNPVRITRTYDGIRKYLLQDCSDQPVEGLIFQHDGVYWKVRADCFLLSKGEVVPFQKNRENARPPIFLA
jgi:hypothetical protein